MLDENTAASKVKEAKKDYCLMAYHLPYKGDKGSLEIDGHQYRNRYSNSKRVSGVIKGPFEKSNPVMDTENLRYRGEIYEPENEDQKNYSTASSRPIDYEIRTHEKESRVVE